MLYKSSKLSNVALFYNVHEWSHDMHFRLCSMDGVFLLRFFLKCSGNGSIYEDCFNF